MSSLFHLRRPERAWRALSQWRSSWLSREGVAALATFVPAVVFLGFEAFLETPPEAPVIAGLATAVLALATIWSTAMIYRSLATVPAWSSPWTVPGFLVMGLSGGGLVICAAALLAEGRTPPLLPALTAAALALCAIVKLGAWRALPRGGSADAASALGLGGRATGVRVLELPSTNETWLQREMVFAIARRHARKLRRLAVLAGFAAPFLLVLAGSAAGGVAGALIAVLAVAANLAGTMVERWLFFAEARHKVSLYFGEERV